MKLQKILDGFFLLCMVMVTVVGVLSCTAAATTTTTASPTTATPGAGGGAVIDSDSVITAKIEAIRQQTTGYPWELDILVETSIDVGDLPNPTKDSIGKVITVKTDADMTYYKTGDEVKAKVKYTGDVPKPGISLYMYDIGLK